MTAPRPPLVLASANPGKLAELRSLLQGSPYDVRALTDYPDARLPPEGVQSYADNALAKARAAVAASGAIALGDDSGIEVDALGGGPGVGSARFGGPGLGDAERAARLLAAVAAWPSRGRQASFRCVLALVAPWGEEALAEGAVEGVLAEAPRGHGGFGYDPIFLVPETGRTFGELSADEKVRLSHRARALEAARPTLERWAGRATG